MHAEFSPGDFGGYKMPRRRWKLSAREELEYAARAQELQEMGVPMEVPSPPQSALELQVACGGNFIFNSSPLHMTLVTEVRMIAMRSGIYLSDEVSVTLPWSGTPFELGYDSGRSAEPYRIADNLSYDRPQVLNERLILGMRLQKGKFVSGVLVLLGQGQLPAEYGHGALMSTEVTLFDSLGAEFSAQAAVRVNRNLERKRETPTEAMTKSSNLWEPLPPKPAINVSVRSQSSEDWLGEMDHLTECTRRMAERAEKRGARPC